MNTTFSPVVIAHVPVDFGHPLVFVGNLLRFKHRYPIILFTARTDVPSSENVTVVTVPDAGNQVLGGHEITNLVFLTACRIAFVRNDFTHMIYLEEDCRVGCDEWDAVMFDEFVSSAGSHVNDAIGGTPMCFGELGLTRLAPKQWQALLDRNVRKNFPVPTYGAARSHDAPVEATCITVCGALGIYSRDLILKLFDLTNTKALATQIPIWDFALGWRLWQRFHVDAFEHVIYLHSVLSSYDLALSTEDERRQMLTDGLKMENGQTLKVVAVHKIKSDWPGPMAMDGNMTTSDEEVAPEILEQHRKILQQQAADTPIQSLALPVAGAPVQTRKDGPEPVVSDKQAPVPSAPAQANPYTVPYKLLSGGQRVQTRVNIDDYEKMPFKFRVDILIVTHAPEAKWLALALKSIGRFCRGFGLIVVVFPKADMDQIQPVLEAPMHDPTYPFDIRPVMFDQVEGKGHLHHMVQTCMADIHCPDADLILHWDSSLVAHAPITPADYMHGDKPVLLMTPYEHLRERRDHYGWKTVTEQVLKEPVHYSCNERLPILHWRELYPMTRQFVELKQGVTLENYVLTVEGVSEFVLLGAVALRTADMVQRYKFLNTVREARPPDLATKWWGQSSPDEPQRAPVTMPPRFPIEADGTVVPRPIINAILEGK